MIPVFPRARPARAATTPTGGRLARRLLRGNATIIAAAANVAASGLAERVYQPIGFTRFLKFGLLLPR